MKPADSAAAGDRIEPGETQEFVLDQRAGPGHPMYEALRPSDDARKPSVERQIRALERAIKESLTPQGFEGAFLPSADATEAGD